MANILIKDGASANKYLKATGAGTDPDPNIPEHAVTNAGLTALNGAIAGTEVQVDVLSSALPAGAATSAAQTSQTTLLAGGLPAALGAGGGLKVDGSGTALPVSGTVTVQDGGGAITVDGTVAVTNADLTTLAGAVAATHMQADIVGALPAGTAVIGTTMDGGPSWTSSYKYTTSADATGTVELTVAPTGGQKIVIDDIIFSADTAMNFIFEEESSLTGVLKIFCPSNGTVQITPRGRIKLPVADKKLIGDASIAGNIAVTVCYHSEA